jgi:glycosyltransferase involved in cell wall biosynthesis
MSGRPSVSVVVPTYNRSDMISAALRSALEQTYAPSEIIVVDDGSTDNTHQVVKLFGDAVTYIWQRNAGVSAARNVGMRRATGEFIALLDSDDVWVPEKTQLQVEWFDRHPDFALLLGDYDIVSKDGSLIEAVKRRRFIPEDGWVLRDVLRAPFLLPSSVMFRRDVLNMVPGFDESLKTAEDLLFHMQVARRFKIGVLSKPLVRYLQGHGSLSSLARSELDAVHAFEIFARDAAHDVPHTELQIAIALANLRAARAQAFTGHIGQCARYSLRALGLSRATEVLRLFSQLPLLALRSKLSLTFRRAVRALAPRVAL